jgi:hypothetical protein
VQPLQAKPQVIHNLLVGYSLRPDVTCDGGNDSEPRDMLEIQNQLVRV